MSSIKIWRLKSDIVSAKCPHKNQVPANSPLKAPAAQRAPGHHLSYMNEIMDLVIQSEFYKEFLAGKPKGCYVGADAEGAVLPDEKIYSVERNAF